MALRESGSMAGSVETMATFSEQCRWVGRATLCLIQAGDPEQMGSAGVTGRGTSETHLTCSTCGPELGTALWSPSGHQATDVPGRELRDRHKLFSAAQKVVRAPAGQDIGPGNNGLGVSVGS